MRVLLAEDHLQLAESVAQALKSTGLTVDVLHDGVAADLAVLKSSAIAGLSSAQIRALTTDQVGSLCLLYTSPSPRDS